MRLVTLSWMVVLVACKPAAEKCFEARDRARAAWVAGADTVRAAMSTDDSAYRKATAALNTMEKIPATLWPCTRSRSIAAGEVTSNLEYVQGAADEARERIATAKQLATVPSADDATKAAIATASAELEKALPELEKQVASAKLSARPSPPLVEAAKRVDAACSQLLTHSGAFAVAASRAAQNDLTAASKASEARLAELDLQNKLLKEVLDAAAQVGTDAPPGLITVPKTLADDPRFAEARRLTQVARDQCKK